MMSFCLHSLQPFSFVSQLGSVISHHPSIWHLATWHPVMFVQVYISHHQCSSQSSQWSYVPFCFHSLLNSPGQQPDRGLYNVNGERSWIFMISLLLCTGRFGLNGRSIRGAQQFGYSQPPILQRLLWRRGGSVCSLTGKWWVAGLDLDLMHGALCSAVIRLKSNNTLGCHLERKATFNTSK